MLIHGGGCQSDPSDKFDLVIGQEGKYICCPETFLVKSTHAILFERFGPR